MVFLGLDLGMRKLGHIFSVELTSKKYVTNISISDRAHDRVLFEGDLGGLLSLALIDGKMLEIEGKNGVIRTTITEESLRSLLNNPNRVLSLSSKLESFKKPI